MSYPTQKPNTIFATGVELQAVECTINDIKQYRWIAINFQDDSYRNGELINPIEFAENQNDLIKQF